MLPVTSIHISKGVLMFIHDNASLKVMCFFIHNVLHYINTGLLKYTFFIDICSNLN